MNQKTKGIKTDSKRLQYTEEFKPSRKPQPKDPSRKNKKYYLQQHYE